jgi:probable addiction module antidote protein
MLCHSGEIMNTSLSHDESVIRMIRDDPAFAAEYLRIAFEELDEEGGEASFLSALRHVVEARGGMTVIAEKAGLSRESLYRALSPRGNPTLRTMRQVVHATGLTFAAIA